MFMLDTNIISDVIRNPDGRAAEALLQAGQDAVCTSIVAACELRYGSQKKGSARLAGKVEEFLSEIEVLPLDRPVDETYALLRCALEAAGTPIGHNDLLIAAHAAMVGATLVTDNGGEFHRIKTLPVVNWMR